MNFKQSTMGLHFQTHVVSDYLTTGNPGNIKSTCVFMQSWSSFKKLDLPTPCPYYFFVFITETMT